MDPSLKCNFLADWKSMGEKPMRNSFGIGMYIYRHFISSLLLVVICSYSLSFYSARQVVFCSIVPLLSDVYALLISIDLLPIISM